jgi:hypothetical protein
MRINQFYTCFLFIFFPFGLILYDFFNLQYIDEILILILVLYTSIHIIGTNKQINKEIYYFTAIIIFYLIYSFYIGITNGKAILLDLQQQIKPYAAFYCTYYLNPTFTQKQKLILNRFINLLVLLIIGIILTGNAQTYFGAPLAALATTMSTLALYYYFFSPAKNRFKKKSFLIMSLGLFSGKSKFMSEYIITAYLFFIKKTKITILSPKFIILLSIFTILISYIIWDKLNYYFIEGLQNSEGIARPLLYKTSFEILKDYFPFGSGFGTFCNEASRSVYSPLYYNYNLQDVWGLSPDFPAFAADCFYPTLSQFGIVGIIFFVLFWRKRYVQIKNCIQKNYIIGITIIITLLLESIADTSYLSNRGIPFFILLALTIKTQSNRLIIK